MCFYIIWIHISFMIFFSFWQFELVFCKMLEFLRLSNDTHYFYYHENHSRSHMCALITFQ